ncbi:MAG: DNA polymerase III subunit beta [Rikenellaceae bacterium]
MKFKISSALLSHVLQNAYKAISPKQTMPILGYFLFVLKEEKLTVTASDLDSTIIAEIEVESLNNGSGRIAVPANTFMDVLRELGDQPITIEIDQDNFEIKMTWSTGDIVVTGLNGFGYPEIENQNIIGQPTSLTLKSEELIAGISKSHFATSNGTARPILTGILIDITPENVFFVATDAHQLVKLTIVKHTDIEEPTSIIIPKKTALLLRSIISKDDGDVVLEFGGNNIKFTVGGYSYISRIIEGKFPNYNGAIPLSNPNKVTVNRLELLNSIKRVSVCSKNSNNLISLSVTADNIFLEAKDFAYSSSANDNVACCYEGLEEKIEINLKAVNFIDMLSALSSNDVLLEMSGNTRAVLLSAIDSEDVLEKSIIMMLMPVTI